MNANNPAEESANRPVVAEDMGLAEQAAFLTSILESSNEYAIVAKDMNGRILAWNAGARQIYGYEPSEVVGKANAFILHDPADVVSGRAQKILDEALQCGRWEGELVRVRKNKSEFNGYVTMTLRRDKAGKPIGYTMVSRDLTEPQRSERHLREFQEYNRGLIESNIDALMITDPMGVITDVNRQMCELTGYGREELINSSVNRYFTDAKRAEDGIRKVLAEDKVTNYELTIRAKDGKETLVSYNATTFKGADGGLRGVFAAARDITVQKILEEKIRKQNGELIETTAFLNNVLGSSIEHSIIAIDLYGNILAWNEGAKRNYGYSQADAVGTLNTRLLHTPEDIESGRVQAMLDTALASGRSEGLFDHRRNDGKIFTASVAVSLRRDSSGQEVGYLFISKDITDQKVLEEQLRRKNEELQEQNRRVQEANRLKSEFLANMSHELRSPLNGIIGFSELMFNGKVGPMADEHKEYLGDILTGARHLLHLINDVLDLAKVESGKVELLAERVNLTNLASEVKDLLSTMADQKKISVDLQVAPGLDHVLLDSGKFKQVLYNYLSNAIKFTPEEGKVQIRFSLRGKEDFLLEVEDNGIGISKQDMNRLFIEFEQLDSGTAKKYGGTGLGLALTKRIVEYQGGKVRVSSREGHGSTFSAILPLSLNTRERRTDDLPSVPPTDRLSVLVVEDDAQDRGWIVNTLTMAGFSVDETATGKDAILKCRERRYDAITLDLILPDLGGWGVLREIRSAGMNVDTPIIAVTVAAQRSAIAAFRIHDLLPKPITKLALLESLERAGLAAGKKVLIVNDDPAIVKMAELAIKNAGWVPLTAMDGESGLTIMGRESPSAVVLDLMMPEMNGYEFLSRMRELPFGREVAVFVWTAKNLTGSELKGLQARVKKIVPIGEGGISPLLEELSCHLKDEPIPLGIAGA